LSQANFPTILSPQHQVNSWVNTMAGPSPIKWVTQRIGISIMRLNVSFSFTNQSSWYRILTSGPHLSAAPLFDNVGHSRDWRKRRGDAREIEESSLPVGSRKHALTNDDNKNIGTVSKKRREESLRSNRRCPKSWIHVFLTRSIELILLIFRHRRTTQWPVHLPWHESATGPLYQFCASL
jgi:hypothetical protein